MIKYENHCCGCAAPGYPCLGSACPFVDVPVYYCDRCKYEIDGDVYEDDDGDLCEDCLKEKYKKSEV